MTHKLTHDGAALVAPAIKWIPITKDTPFGAKCLVIDQVQGIAYLRALWPGNGWTHYHPLPRFNDSQQLSTTAGNKT